MSHVNRRRFLKDSTLAAAGLAAASELAPSAPLEAEDAAAVKNADFVSRWDQALDRVWLGPEYWANPLQDWRIAYGRIECVRPAIDRNVHLLTRQLGEEPGTLMMSVRVGRLGGALKAGQGTVGFRLGIQGPLREYRNNLLSAQGIGAGITSTGGLFLGKAASTQSTEIDAAAEAVELRLSAEPQGNAYAVTLSAHDPVSGKKWGEIRRDDVPASELVGNIALAVNFGQPQTTPAAGKKGKPAPGGGFGTFWFADWRVSGTKLIAQDEQAFGPILFSQYTLSEGVLKLTAQMPPVGAQDSQVVLLELQSPSGQWNSAGEAPIHPEARTATFRLADWNAGRHVACRLVYALRNRNGDSADHYWTGTIRRDPVDQDVLTVADISCNTHAAFPNAEYATRLGRLNPDFIAFVGDQFYESSGGYGVVRAPVDVAILDYLRKWYLHGWTWRELTRDRPCVSLPDDHDVYQGNIWGEGGAAQHGTQEEGGYNMAPAWVNVVHRTQASHHPDPPDPAPMKQDISVWFGPITYGRVSFAIIADRMFKTAPEGHVPPTGDRGDHVIDPNFDPRTADLPGLELLGERQMKFLRRWAADWRGADMKAVISQTIFTAMATTHGGNRERLQADYDANGWPQTARNQALEEIRKAFATHLAGDQHLPAVVHYGVREHRDGPMAFAGPAVNVGYPRWWEPEKPGTNRRPGAPEITGDFLDHFGNPMTVLAVANGAVKPRTPLMEQLADRASGLGIARFDKARRTVTFECWPLSADPSSSDAQFPGWPVTFSAEDNYGRAAQAWLPTLEIAGLENPVVQVVEEKSGEIVYTLRIKGSAFQPKVFAAGKYTVRVSDPDQGKQKELAGLSATAKNDQRLRVEV